MKLHKCRLRWCTFLVIITKYFSRRLESFHRILLAEYLTNTLISWNLAIIMFCKFPFYLYQRKKKMNVNFTREFFDLSTINFFKSQSFKQKKNLWNLGPKIPYLAAFGRTFEELLLYWKQVPSIWSDFKISRRSKNY